jgi:predicted DNA-binding protein
MRIVISLSKEKHEELKKLRTEIGTPVSELVRRAIDIYIKILHHGQQDGKPKSTGKIKR